MPEGTAVRGKRATDDGVHPQPPQRTCPVCGELYTGRSTACSRRCLHWAKKHPDVPVPTTCGWCSGSLAGRAYGSRYCSDVCVAKVGAQRRRAARNGKPVHRIDPVDIFERDGWICHICAEPIDRSQSGKQPGAPALDHLIPVAHPDYPGHIAANVAASHWVCNTAKNCRATTEDFALYERLKAKLPPGVPVKRNVWDGPGPRTHCSAGHEWTPENTYRRPDNGARMCKECIRDRQRKSPPRKLKGPRTHCKAGHEFTPENTYVRKGGKWRACRACHKRLSQGYAERDRVRPLRDPNRCDAGHAWTPENTYNPPGQPQKKCCKECRRRRNREWRRAQRVSRGVAGQLELISA